MSETFEPFDIENIDSRDIAGLLASRAWTDFYEPMLRATIARWYVELADPSLQRRSRMPDDYLRGGIKVLNAALQYPYDVIAARIKTAKENEQNQSEEAFYEHLVGGDHGPLADAAQGDAPREPIGG